MSKRKGGAHKWVPAVVIDEIEDIMQTEQVNVPQEAMHRMVQYSRKGRANNEPPLMRELRALGQKRRKKKGPGGIFE